MKSILSIILLFGTFEAQLFSQTDSSTKERDAELTKKISTIISETASLKAGGKRSDLLNAFKTEGGISTSSHRTYVSRVCPYVKIDVTFQPVAPKESSPEDTILNISKPYLEYSIID